MKTHRALPKIAAVMSIYLKVNIDKVGLWMSTDMRLRFIYCRLILEMALRLKTVLLKAIIYRLNST